MSNDWITVSSVDDFPPGDRKTLTVNDLPVVVFHQDNEFFAYQDFCPHVGRPIGEGTIEEGNLYCPYHGAGFCLKTGKSMGPPAYSDLIAFPLRIEGGNVQVKAP